MQCNYNTVWVLLNFVSTQDVLVWCMHNMRMLFHQLMFDSK